MAVGAILVVGATALPATAATAPKACDGIPKQKISKLRADNVGCATARKVAKGWKRTGPSKGFDCGYYPITNSKQIESVRCEKDEAVVTFKKRWIGMMPFPTFGPILSPSTMGN